MLEITCPKCNQIQKKSKNNFCSYCFYKFDNNITDNNLKQTDSKFIDKKVNIEKQKILISKSKSIILFIIVSIILILSLIINEILFPFSVENYFPVKIFILISIITSTLIYRFLNKKYDLNTYIDEIFTKPRSGRNLTFLEKKFSFFITFIMLSFMINFVFLNLINNFTSIIFLPKTYKTFIVSKSTKRIKNGYNYYIHLINWEKKGIKNEIKVKVPKKLWYNYVENQRIVVKVRYGLFWNVIWDLKQNI
ncbi:MAG: hypothetical protein KatS3mg068_1368 [Candidatus Sericytochromatia bacterium]|nr:MAG: hypothetical protein KatS3mg068_1368 [Candidatus Sericytochromatia bacterium]